ncbi:glycerophosphodiester phosphodiesterase family protein [Pararhodobacter sp. SW119]|uniref:glycerophosphodiester phosphodiesterase family protein n=1 Tax=Pararhodobacter sp. SW119 TaxID=2780075 RepID=UPI001ADF9330|nr:glycerophosphodiester phosphodiesterase family protein [Pararhodobacter sp. SW119]
MPPALPRDFLHLPIAHRALHGPGRPENSTAAIAAAVAAGYGIEIDLQGSADGVAMVFHDDTLDRLTAEAGPVRGRAAADLAQIALNGADGGGIPTLADVLALVAGRVPLLVEIKDQSGGMGPVDEALEKAAAAALRGYGGPVAVMSFNPHSMAAMARHAPDVPRGLTTYAFPKKDAPSADADPAIEAGRKALARIVSFDDVGASFISHDWHDLARPRVAELKARGVPVLSWTIRSPEEEAVARRVADNITFEGYLPPLPATGTADDGE